MNYHNITCPDMNNGDGLRVVLWLSGCSHRCKGCQNPQTWSPKSGIEFDAAAYDELMQDLSLDYISGITISGGDPLHKVNRIGVLGLCKSIRKQYGNTKTIWLYTGYECEEILNDETMSDIFRLCDIVVDGVYVDKLRDVSLHWRGSSNQRVIDVETSLKTGVICEVT